MLDFRAKNIRQLRKAYRRSLRRAPNGRVNPAQAIAAMQELERRRTRINRSIPEQLLAAVPVAAGG